MQSSIQYGYYLFKKPHGHNVALKDMLQFMRTHGPPKSAQFAHVECETSLLPHLSLWENIHVVTGGPSWSEQVLNLDSNWKALVGLIKNPDVLSKDSAPWERLTVSLLKGTLMNTHHLMIEIDEKNHAPFNILSFKKMITILAEQKNIYVSTTNTSLWLDSAHSLVSRNGYEFIIEELDQARIKRHKSA